MDFNLVKIEVFIPENYVEELRFELNKIGALTIDGKYDNCMSIYSVKGLWRPLEGSNPYLGEVGEICETEEFKVEFSCRREIIGEAVEVIKRVHPYETPVINVIPMMIIG
ncbi:divalent cation tolerance protein CutA [Clostridium bovifaecis]|uniref:Divalent cation tolerance protein CutA n=1 Tax=Clostridium bovifaecis TaxID=2184719 RepID=A0A6I6EWU0_9CLOT|nr:divalent cation tolerance protein CutA [Clostridium bovifaecis]